MSYIVIVKLSQDELDELQLMKDSGMATEFELKMYAHCYDIPECEQHVPLDTHL